MSLGGLRPVSRPHRHSYMWEIATKRLVDLLAVILSLPIVVPLIGLLSLFVWLDTGRPIFFSDKRLGLGSKVFCCLKFRTMHVGGDRLLKEYLHNNPQARQEWDMYHKLRGHDPRVTRLGAFLRRWSLDEVPQLINILRGDMSLVGPRPYMVSELTAMGAVAREILSVRPGLTGLWQVSGRNEMAFDQRLELEAVYVRRWNLVLDVTLLIRTFGALVNRTGAS